MDQTARFALPQLSPGQAQKEWYHNEALQRIDMLLSPAVEGVALAAPPSSPPVGACYLVASGATGAWAGEDGALATFTDGGWRFVASIDGARVLDRTSGQMVVRRGGSWEAGIVRAQEVRINGLTVLGDRQAAVPDPAGGSVVDAQCRGGGFEHPGSAQDAWPDRLDLSALIQVAGKLRHLGNRPENCNLARQPALS